MNVVVYVQAGGEGKRMWPVSKERCKGAIPVGASYRTIDWVLSNLYNSHYWKVCVTTQWRNESLHKHLRYGWQPLFGFGSDKFLEILPAQQGMQGGWYEGTADAIAKRSNFIREENPDLVNILVADQIYVMDFSQFNDFHLDKGADLTISAVPVPVETARGNLGVLVADSDGRILDFEEKPENPKELPGRPGWCLASLGNYAIRTNVLREALDEDQAKMFTPDPTLAREHPGSYSTHDLVNDIIIPSLAKGWKVYACPFDKNTVPGQVEPGYVKEISTPDALFEANEDLRRPIPRLNLYDMRWEIRTHVESSRPVKLVGNAQVGIDTLLANGVIVSNARVERTVVHYNTQIETGTVVEDSILFANSYIGEGCHITNTLLEKNRVPPGTVIGENKDHDRARGFTVTPGGRTIVEKNYRFS